MTVHIALELVRQAGTFEARASSSILCKSIFEDVLRIAATEIQATTAYIRFSAPRI